MPLGRLHIAPVKLPFKVGFVGLPAAALVLLPGMSSSDGRDDKVGYRGLSAKALSPEL